MRTKDLQKEEAIYAAALKLVLAEGFSGLKMSEVAKAAGVATGTVYVYFKDKDELINKLYLHLKGQSTAAYLKGYNEAAPFMVCFGKLWKSYLGYSLNAPEIAAFLEQYYRSPFLSPEVRQGSDPLLTPIYALLERGKKERLLKDVPADLMAIQLSGAMAELVRWHHRGQIKAGPAIIRKAFELAWDSIRR